MQRCFNYIRVWKRPHTLLSYNVSCSDCSRHLGFCLERDEQAGSVGALGRASSWKEGKQQNWRRLSPWPSPSPVQPFPESTIGSTPIHSWGEPQTLGADLAQTDSLAWPLWGWQMWSLPDGERVTSLSPSPPFIFRTILIGNLALLLPTFSEVIRMLIYKKDVY